MNKRLHSNKKNASSKKQNSQMDFLQEDYTQGTSLGVGKALNSVPT